MDQGKTILIVEDDNMFRELLVLTLKGRGYNTLEAADGKAGLDMALDKHPDLILLDVMMPKMSGLEVLVKIREDSWGKNAEIFFLTGVDPDDKTIEKISRYSASYYFFKKGDSAPNELLEKISEKFK